MEGERVEEMGGMGFVARCFPACPMLPSRSRVGGRSGLFVPVWIPHVLAPGTKSSAAFQNELCALAFGNLSD